jgi:hypothetical protein
MSEDIGKMLELAKPAAPEPPGKDAPRHCSRWATASLWAGGIGLMLMLLAFALTECKWEHSDDMMVIAWLLGIVAWVVTMVSSVVGLIRIACPRGKRWGYGRAWMGLGLGLLTGLGLLMWAVGMVARTFRW